MLTGLIDPHDPRAVQAPLSDEEEESLDEFFVFLSMAPSEYYALPKAKQEHIASLMQTWHLSHLILTRTAVKKQ